MTKHAAPLFAEVAPAVPLPPGRTTYTYRLPKKSNTPTLSAVTIPFGPRRVPGIVLEVHSRRPRYSLKYVSLTSNIRLITSQISFARSLARTMHAGLGFTLRLFLPPLSAKPRGRVSGFTGPHEVLRGTPQIKQYLQILNKNDVALIETDSDKRRTLLNNLVAAYTRRTKKTALILVPEKALLGNWESWTRVTADLPRAQLAAVWHSVANGTIPAVVGTQKALFLPFSNLGLIVVEEEAWPTHKLWDQYPRLHSADAARMLASIHGARILWSGSFPSIRLHAAIKNQSISAPSFQPIELHPEVHLFSRADYTNKSVLPQALIAALRPGVIRKQPTLLLYNSRRADKTKDIRRLLHRAFGKHFPLLTLATTAIFAEAKPKDFSQAAWLFPESTFTYPDFRSEEHGLITLSRLQQLLPPGQSVHITTRSLTLAQRLLQWQPLDWYDTILAERRALGYPPFADALKLTVIEKTAAKAQRRAEKLRDTLEKRITDANIAARIFGPFVDLAAAPKSEASQHILLLGDAATLPDIYADLKIDAVDLSPHKIL